MAKVIYYHFSDLHFKHRDDFDRNRVLSALWKDVKDQMGAGLVPDFVLITGDIAYSGVDEEYRRAELEFVIPLLELTGLTHDRLFIVPGNHDLDRSLLSNLNPAKVFALKDRTGVNAFLGDDASVEAYFKPFVSYANFVRRVASAEQFSVSPAYW